MQKELIITFDQDFDDIDQKFLHRVFEETMERSGVRLSSVGVISHIRITDKQNIQKLNRQYRGKNKPTDVLSFWNFSSIEEIERESRKDDFVDIGELVVCYGIIKEASLEDGVSFERELAFIVSHGFLHLLGFDHGEEMFAIQDEVCEVLTKG